ncbi:MAG TPA: hypothetical protein VGT41_02440 [Candidatus Babeliales bacterium]|nr:hypothetical protein [Candidatus Babeliales bacterium]
MKKNKHIGSSFESFLEAEGILEEVSVAAVKAVIAQNLKNELINPQTAVKQNCRHCRQKLTSHISMLQSAYFFIG